MPARAAITAAVLALLAALPVRSGAACPESSRDPYAPRVFMGYRCKADCEDQKAGFAWAERHAVADPAACRGLPAGAREGCRAYAEEAVTPQQAGFEWARENEIGDGCRCGGAGPAFAAGCEAYLDSLGE